MSKRQYLTTFEGVPDDLIRLEQLLSNGKKIEFVTRKIKIDSVEFTTIDVKLSPWQEEALYKDDEIRILVPRGLCFIFANNVWIYTLYGHPKFGDITKNDSGGCHGEYLPKGVSMDTIDKTTTKVFRRKENGECAHWGAFIFNDVIYEVYGSKNVHMVVRSEFWESDLNLYSDPRYSFATKMAQLINTYDKSRALPYLIRSGLTLCGEGCFTDSQHFVKYDVSTMFFFAVTGKRYLIDTSIVKVNPIEIDNFVKSLNLIPVLETIVSDGTKLNCREIELYFERIPNSEGAVVSCVNSSGSVIYMYKHKNHDYVYQRAFREQMKKQASTLQILERFSRMHIVHYNHDVILERLFKFNAWYRQENFTADERKTFFENWVTMTERFDRLGTDKQNEFLRVHNESERSSKPLEVIFMMGIPGSGKSFVARSLEQILKLNGKSVVHLEQDMFKGSNPLYQKAIVKAFENPQLDYLILAKGNHSKAVRDATYKTLDTCVRCIHKTFVVLSTGGENMHDTMEICIKRILSRGLAHETLFGKSEKELRKILSNVFVNGWESLTESECTNNVINNVIRLEINQEKTQLIKSFCSQAYALNMMDFEVSEEKLIDIFSQINQKDNELSIKNQ